MPKSNRKAPFLSLWRALLNVMMMLLSIRFIVGAVLGAYPYPEPILLLSVGTALLTWWRPSATFFAFTLGVPLLNGLGESSLLPYASPPALVFCSIALTLSFRSFISDKSFGAILGSTRGEGQETRSLSFIVFAIDLMLSAVVVSLFAQLWHHRAAPQFWRRVLWQQVFGYSDPLYFITSAFLWIQGLFYFRFLLRLSARSREAGVVSQPSPDSPSASLWRSEEPEGANCNLMDWCKAAFFVYGITIIAFITIQYVFGVPEGWTIAGYFSPFEDISSFGSLAVAVFLFFVATLGPGSRTRLILQIAFCVLLAVMVIASFSRATWLAAGIFLLVVAWQRLPKKILAAFFAVAVVGVFAVNANVNNTKWRENPYWVRLVALVRFENPLHKDAGRINLYYKGMGMMQSRPLVGHGIGSFYLTSTLYPNPDDPFGYRPDFAHDIFLQVATELGIPVALLFAALCILVLYLAWTGLKSNRGPFEHRASPGIGAHPKIVNLPLLGAAIALSAYLTTQLTANSLNVYISNQLFCWFLAAIIVDYVTRGCPRTQP